MTFGKTHNSEVSAFLPSTDSGNQLLIDFTYELVLQASRAKDGHTYFK